MKLQLDCTVPLITYSWYIYTHTCLYKQTYTYVPTCAHIYTHAQAHAHTHVHKHTYTYVYTCAPTHIHTCILSLSPWKCKNYLYGLGNFLTHNKLHLVIRDFIMSTILINNVARHHYRPTMRSRIRHYVHNWHIVYKTPIMLLYGAEPMDAHTDYLKHIKLLYQPKHNFTINTALEISL